MYRKAKRKSKKLSTFAYMSKILSVSPESSHITFPDISDSQVSDNNADKSCFSISILLWSVSDIICMLSSVNNFLFIHLQPTTAHGVITRDTDGKG